MEVGSGDDDLRCALRHVLDLVGPLARDLDRGLDGLGAGVHRQHQVGAGQLGEFPAEQTELVVVESPYRALIGPLLRYMDALQAQDPDRPIVVVLTEIVPRHWWENLLHNQTSLRLKLRLFGRKNTIVADVPFHIGD